MIKKSLALIMAAMIAMSLQLVIMALMENLLLNPLIHHLPQKVVLYQKQNQRLHQIQNRVLHHQKQANLLSIQFQI